MTTIAKFLWPIPDRNLARRLPRISAPTLVVFGEQDAFVPPRYAEDFVAAIPDSSSRLVAAAGHMVSRERPEQLRELVEEFMLANAVRV
jgi:pimeloyl-ACP methyl ester carboxylesterase